MLSADKKCDLRWENKGLIPKRSEMDGAEEFA